jgi:hypothetical protein
MSYYKKIRILALVTLALTLASLIGAVNSAYWDFSQAVVLSFVTIFLLIITVLLFNSSIDRSKPRQTPVQHAAPARVEPVPAVAQANSAIEQTNQRSSTGTVVLIFAGIAGVISLFAAMDGSRYTGSGSMGGLLDYAIISVSGPATAILGLIGLVLKLSEPKK